MTAELELEDFTMFMKVSDFFIGLRFLGWPLHSNGNKILVAAERLRDL